MAQSVGVVEYTDCNSAERHDFPKECSDNETKQSDFEAPVMQERWGMQSSPSLPSFPGALWTEVLSPDRVLSMGQMKLNSVLMLNWIDWNRTVNMSNNGFGI